MNDSNKKDDIHKNKNERNNNNANNEYKNIRNNNFKFKKFYIIGGIILLFAIIFFNLGINLEELKGKQEKKMIFIQKTKKVGILKKEKMMTIIMMMVLIIFF